MKTKNNKKLKVGIFYGGPSAEHEVSVSSANQIFQYIDKQKYNPVKIKVSKTGKWQSGYSIQNLKSKIDFAFIAMHGSYGEDGTIQAIFESIGIPYSGSRVLASGLAMHKNLSQKLASMLGAKVPTTWVIGTDEINISQLPDKLIIKPNDGGSTNGLQLLSKSQFKKDFLKIKRSFKGHLLQERIIGRELTVPVLGNKSLPVIEILSENEIYDYDAKYTAGKSKHIINPQLPVGIDKKAKEFALAIHNLIGCRAMSRTDFLLKGKSLYYLETNTIPGMTKTSLLPESAQVAGINFTKLIDQIIKYSL